MYEIVANAKTSIRLHIPVNNNITKKSLDMNSGRTMGWWTGLGNNILFFGFRENS
jgi:hypothetical protein